MGGHLAPRFWVTVFINWAAFLLLAWLLGWSRYRLEFMKRKVEEAHALESLELR
jgi:hypothetical protein